MEIALTLEAVRARRPEALATLVGLHQRRLRGFVAVLWPDLGAVDDLAQEVFLRALRLVDRIEDLENFDRFLRGIARNVVREHARKHSARFQSFERYADRVAADAEPAPPDDDEKSRTLATCLEKLPARSRDLLDLRYRRDKNSSEIARDWGMKAGAVRALLLRVREALLKCVQSGTSPVSLEFEP